MNHRIIAVDFDGTLCENKWPEIGEPNRELIEYLKKAQSDGDKLILWTARNEEQTQKAVDWCKEQELIFDAVNDNLPENIEYFGGNSRKVYATDYIDDKNLPIASCRKKSKMEFWAENEVTLAYHLENPDQKDEEWDYGCACYESALKAFRSLCEDGHSGFSIALTKAILNRLIDCKPLIPIEDTEDVWSAISDVSGLNSEKVSYQCKRMYSLFKDVYTDGSIKYCDMDRYCGVDIKTDSTYSSFSLISHIVDEMFPITMPYMPEDRPYEVYTEDFLTDPEEGDFDTVGVLYVITPSLERVEINRYFKAAENRFDEPTNSTYWTEIGEAEYRQRREAAKARTETADGKE